MKKSKSISILILSCSIISSCIEISYGDDHNELQSCEDKECPPGKQCVDGRDLGYNYHVCVKSCLDRRYVGPNCDQCAEGFYGENCSFSEMTDQEGHVYKTVIQDGQEWMAENLKTTKDIDGNKVTCYANTEKDPNFVENYGCLYTWADAMKICPDGWRLPTKKDFENLLSVTGYTTSTKLRDPSWDNGSNSSGFGALPAGRHWVSSNSEFVGFGSEALFWSITSDDSTHAYSMRVYGVNQFSDNGSSQIEENPKSEAYSVRCIWDLK